MLKVMSIVEMAILSTDLASYFEKRERFLKSANAGEFEWQVQGAHKNYTSFSRTLCFLQLSLTSPRVCNVCTKCLLHTYVEEEWLAVDWGARNFLEHP